MEKEISDWYDIRQRLVIVRKALTYHYCSDILFKKPKDYCQMDTADIENDQYTGMNTACLAIALNVSQIQSKTNYIVICGTTCVEHFKPVRNLDWY